MVLNAVRTVGQLGALQQKVKVYFSVFFTFHINPAFPVPPLSQDGYKPSVNTVEMFICSDIYTDIQNSQNTSKSFNIHI